MTISNLKQGIQSQATSEAQHSASFVQRNPLTPSGHSTRIALPAFESLQLIRPKPAAKLMGISMATFWRLVRAETLHTVKLSPKITAVRASEIEALIASKTKS